MLFSKKYPNANEEGSYEYGNYIYVEKADNCHICGRLTHFVELNTGGYFCSNECENAFYKEVFRLAKSGNF